MMRRTIWEVVFGVIIIIIIILALFLHLLCFLFDRFISTTKKKFLYKNNPSNRSVINSETHFNQSLELVRRKEDMAQ
jgi:hypothetical protein